MTTKCILVGNGTSILDRSTGADIDRHECVVRFNAFTLTGYERHTGTHCDEWFTVQTATTSPARTNHPWKHVYVHSWQPDPAKCPVWGSHRKIRQGHDLSKLDHALVTEISEYFGVEFKPWSTGLLAIWQKLKNHDAVTITGFDWWDREDHHYNDKAVRGNLHRPQLERDCINRLAGEGRLYFL